MLRSNRVPTLECLFCQRLDDEVIRSSSRRCSLSRKRAKSTLRNPPAARCFASRIPRDAICLTVEPQPAEVEQPPPTPFFQPLTEEARGARGADGSRAAGRRKRSGGLKG